MKIVSIFILMLYMMYIFITFNEKCFKIQLEMYEYINVPL